MTDAATHEITELLKAWGQGDKAALDELTDRCYRELRRLARHHMRGERAGHSLQTSALVNEAFLRLTDWKNVDWQNRAHFFAMAARIMRNILVDFAKRRQSIKHGAEILTVSLSVADSLAQEERGTDLIALDEALNELAGLNPRQSRVVELKFFGGLNIDEIAAILEVSAGTVRRDWSLAQAWLYRELSKRNQ